VAVGYVGCLHNHLDVDMNKFSSAFLWLCYVMQSVKLSTRYQGMTILAR
jgi:hypothetical protein